MLAKVPRIITSWLPRRVPYWLKSIGLTLCSTRYFPAGESSLIEPAGERIGHHQRRRGEIIRAHVGVDAALEVAVAGEHGSGHKIGFVDGLGDFRREGAGVADTGGAAEADQVVAELVEVFL